MNTDFGKVRAPGHNPNRFIFRPLNRLIWLGLSSIRVFREVQKPLDEGLCFWQENSISMTIYELFYGRAPVLRRTVQAGAISSVDSLAAWRETWATLREAVDPFPEMKKAVLGIVNRMIAQIEARMADEGDPGTT